MKALLDQNLSHRLVDVFSERFPGSGHVRDHRLTGDDDETIWSLAKDEGFFIVTKDSDFLARALAMRARLLSLVTLSTSPVWLAPTMSLSSARFSVSVAAKPMSAPMAA